MSSLGDFLNTDRWPDAGRHHGVCIGVEKGKSPKKQTPQIELTWLAQDGEAQFRDQLYVTVGAIRRLALVASHVCGLAKETTLPDDQTQAMLFLAKHIMDNVLYKEAIVTVEKIPEEYMVQDGPEVGQKKTRMRTRVAFNGYDKIPFGKPASAPSSQPAAEPKDEDLPF